MMFFLSRIIVVIIPNSPSYSKQFRKLGILPVYLHVTILFTYLCKSHFFTFSSQYNYLYIYICVCKDKKILNVYSIFPQLIY